MSSVRRRLWRAIISVVLSESEHETRYDNKTYARQCYMSGIFRYVSPSNQNKHVVQMWKRCWVAPTICTCSILQPSGTLKSSSNGPSNLGIHGPFPPRWYNMFQSSGWGIGVVGEGQPGCWICFLFVEKERGKGEWRLILSFLLSFLAFSLHGRKEGGVYVKERDRSRDRSVRCAESG